MEVQKIGVACFIGAFVCYVVAALFAPAYMILGVVAGFASGYLAYEFREVLRAIPVAWSKTREKFSLGFGVIQELRKTFQEAAFERRVYFYPGAVLATFLYCGFLMFASLNIVPGFMKGDRLPFLVFLGITVVMVIPIALLCLSLSNVVLLFLADIGSQRFEHCYFVWLFGAGDEMPTGLELERLEEQGFCRAELTYGNFFRWVAEGILFCAAIIISSPVWVPLLIVYTILRLGYKGVTIVSFFPWKMFVLIHSDKRLLCGIDGALGGAIAFLCLYSSSLSMGEHVLIAGFGGSIGAVLGILNWEVISVRLLKVAT